MNGIGFRRKEMNKIHNIKSVNFNNNVMVLTIDGKEYNFDLAKCSKKLLNASVSQKNNYVISPSGYGIHWPMIDEDLSIDGLLGIKHNVPAIEKAY